MESDAKGYTSTIIHELAVSRLGPRLMHVETATDRNRLSGSGAAQVAREKDCELRDFLRLDHPFYCATLHSASILLKPITPCFAAAYAPRRATPCKPATDAMFTMRP